MWFKKNMTVKGTKKKRSPKVVAKDKAWEAFSKWIRLRDCLITTGTTTHGRCFTCDRLKRFQELQAGHFISGRGNSVLFEEDIVHAQCLQCNYFKGGNKDSYEIKMAEVYTKKQIEGFRALKNKTKEYSLEDYQEIRKCYEEEYERGLANN